MAAAVALAGPSALASPTTPLDYEKVTQLESFIDGPASNQSADITGDSRPELIVSIYGPYEVVAGEAVLQPGSVEIYSNTSKKKGNKDDLQSWKKTQVFGPEEDITFPTQIQVADMDGDGDKDLVGGHGFFWDSVQGIDRGGVTWWENRETPRSLGELLGYAKCLFAGNWSQVAACIEDQRSWKRNTLLKDAPPSFHNVNIADIDGDGKKDVVTVGEEGITRQAFTDDIVELMYFRNLGNGNYSEAISLADRGGSSPYVIDVDGDGDQDVVSAQYFHVSPIVLGPPAGDGSFVWFENIRGNGGALSSDDFVKHEISRGQGPSYGIYPVKNLFGDGQLRYVGVNHTNNTPGTPGPPVFLQAAPNIFLLTPGADIRAPWTVAPLATSVEAGAAFRAEPRPGQAAPGKPMFNDMDGDGDLDIALSGDGDFRAFLLEQTAPGQFHQSVLPGSEGWGQAGISVADYNRDGKLEISLSSFENDQIAIWERQS
jgi:hypothetical protein